MPLLLKETPAMNVCFWFITGRERKIASVNWGVGENKEG